ncbi:MAG: hypothetical protein K2G33_07080, partial [Duncaniella sp.]|nr:hypothetical protein [Duncaniella sp.]
MSFSSVQNRLGKYAERELSTLLGTEVAIGEVSFSPFNRITLSDVSVLDDNGQVALSVGHLGAGISIGETLWNKRIIITYAELIDLNLKLYKDSANAPLNIQPIIARLNKGDKNTPSKFDLAVNMVVIRRSNVQFDIMDALGPVPGKFDKNHIFISDLRADLQAPEISNGRFIIDIKRLAATERSGIVLEELSSHVEIDSISAVVDNFNLVLPSSELKFGKIAIASPLSPDFDVAKSLLSPVSILDGSHLSIQELAPFVPAFNNIDTTFDIELLAEGTLDDLEIKKIDISDRDLDIWVKGTGYVRNLTKGRDSLTFSFQKFDIGVNLPSISKYASLSGLPFNKVEGTLMSLNPLGLVNLTGNISGTSRNLDLDGRLLTDCGDIDIDFGIMRGIQSEIKIDGTISSSYFDPSLLGSNLSKFTGVSVESEFDLAIYRNGNIKGNTDINIPEIEYGGYKYTDITANAVFTGNNADIE